VTTCFL